MASGFICDDGAAVLQNCVTCNEEFSPAKPGRGRPRKTCSPACSEKWRSNTARPRNRRSRSFLCEVCKRPFLSTQSKAKCCSKECQKALLSDTNRAVAAAHAPRCIRCGNPVLRKKRSAAQIKAGYRQRTCSRACSNLIRMPDLWRRQEHAEAVQSERVSSLREERKAARRDSARRKAQTKAVDRMLFEAVRASRSCTECGCSLKGYRITTSRCNDCGRKKARRTGKAQRKARMRAAEREPGLDPLAIFERDGWRCYLCGAMTLKEARGTSHPLAPELEHIIPLSKGGPHISANTACACRSCNIAKGDGIGPIPPNVRKILKSFV